MAFDVNKEVEKWIGILIGLFVLGTIGAVFLALVFGSAGPFRADSALDNATGNSYTTLLVAVGTIGIILFVVGLITILVSTFKKHR